MVPDTPVVRRSGNPYPALAPTLSPTGAMVDFEVRNATGTLVGTFDSAELARAFVLRSKLRFPTLRVEKVETTIRREVIYRPRTVTP